MTREASSIDSRSSAITVAVRVRPFHSGTATVVSDSGLGSSDHGVQKIITVIDEQVLVFDPADPNVRTRRRTYAHGAQRGRETRYGFDRVFSESATQQEVFEGTARPLIDGVLNGYNATVFAYGATGCGKTHTITGTPQDPGIIFLTMRELFARIDKASDEKTFETHVSYLEVYNEAIRDLLKMSTTESLDLREDDVNSRVIVAGLSEHAPKDVDHVMRMLIDGNNNRTKAPTEANAVSSRSHAVLQIHIRQRDRAAGMTNNVKMATLSIIDLAGSERASATKNQGKRLIEGANINRSLLALGNCINALCSDRPNHIPYRDSKLTRLLKYSLGGNCRTVMITAVSASSVHKEETHNTLKYANRAKNIKTTVEQNTIDVAAHMAHFPKVINDLKMEVEHLRGQLGQARVEMNSRPVALDVGVRDAAFEMLVRKVQLTFEKMRQKELEKIQALAEVDKNERKLGVLRAAVSALNAETVDALEVPTMIRSRIQDLYSLIEVTHNNNVGLRHNANQARLGVLRHDADLQKVEQSSPGRKMSDEQKNRLRVDIQLLRLSAQNAMLAKQVELYHRDLETESQALQDVVGKSGNCMLKLAGIIRIARQDDLVGEEVITLIDSVLHAQLEDDAFVTDQGSHTSEVVDLEWDTSSETSDASYMLSDATDMSDSETDEAAVPKAGYLKSASYLEEEIEAMARSFTPTPANLESSDESGTPDTPIRPVGLVEPATAVKMPTARAAPAAEPDTPPSHKRRASPQDEGTVKKSRQSWKHDSSESETNEVFGTPTRKGKRQAKAVCDADATPLAKPRQSTVAPASTLELARLPPSGPVRTSPVRRSQRRLQTLIPISKPSGRRQSMLPLPANTGIGSTNLNLVSPPTNLAPPSIIRTSGRRTLRPSSSSAGRNPGGEVKAKPTSVLPASRVLRTRPSVATPPVVLVPSASKPRLTVTRRQPPEFTVATTGSAVQTRSLTRRIRSAAGSSSSADGSDDSGAGTGAKPLWK
ncbi:kinesin-like protein Klp5 [Thoreauomyces humboldtii]|nr:kinesin-like protein Klp5 [Thoreauomyces humboldtii]